MSDAGTMTVIEGADRSTFKVIQTALIGAYAKDKNNYYYGTHIMTEAAVLEIGKK